MKKLLVEYRVFLSQMQEIKEFLIKIDKNNHIEKLQSLLLESDGEIDD